MSIGKNGKRKRPSATKAGVAVGLYAFVGVLLCVSWFWFFHYLSRHPELTEADTEDDYFTREGEKVWWEKELAAAKRAEASKARRVESFEEWLPKVSNGMSWTARHFV